MNWPLPTPLEAGANAFNLASIFLAARNSVHTWWTGILGCILLGILFFQVRLYADMCLQAFFIATSIIGWRHWSRGQQAAPVRTTPLPQLGIYATAAAAFTGIWAWVLLSFTNAAAPWTDSAVLSLSVAGQLLLMHRRVESWWFWVAVNALSIPMYFSRGLNLTGALYILFLVNSIWGLWRWYRLVPPKKNEMAPE